MADSTSYDWKSVHNRIASLSDNGVSNEERRAILRRRAELLAEAPTSDEATTETVEYVEFRVGASQCAIDAACVVETAVYEECAPLPNMPPYLRGLQLRHGRIVGVIDLATFLKLNEGESDPQGLIFVSNGERMAGIAVDEVSGISHLIESDIASVEGASHVGTTHTGVLILDASRVLDDARLNFKQHG